MTQITIIEKEDYIVLFIKPESLDDHDGHHDLDVITLA
jgi:hypothetical protein